jgi:hypothetical protein
MRGDVLSKVQLFSEHNCYFEVLYHLSFCWWKVEFLFGTDYDGLKSLKLWAEINLLFNYFLRYFVIAMKVWLIQGHKILCYVLHICNGTCWKLWGIYFTLWSLVIWKCNCLFYQASIYLGDFIGFYNLCRDGKGVKEIMFFCA